MTINDKYEMWLTHNAEKEKIQLPVLPESLQITNGSNNSKVDIIGLGEIVVMKSRPALRISFASFFPAAKFPGLQVETITKPLTLIQRINAWKESRKPIHFIVTSCGVDIYAAIENFKYSEVGGDPGTYQYSLDLKEYREIKVRQVKVDLNDKTATVSNEEPRVDNSVAPQTHTVVSGDCLWNIAKKYYGSGADYTKIYEANKEVVGSNPNLIYPGQVLTIP